MMHEAYNASQMAILLAWLLGQILGQSKDSVDETSTRPNDRSAVDEDWRTCPLQGPHAAKLTFVVCELHFRTNRLLHHVHRT